jgi:hypothetical protein
MPLVTGSLRDITEAAMPGKTPEILFTLHAPEANTAGRVYPTEPIVVKPSNSGAWSVELADTTRMIGNAYYTIQLRWRGGNTAATLWDFPNWRVAVSQFGGKITDCIVSAADNSNRRVLWVGLQEPPNPFAYQLYLEQDPNDPTNPANTGRLYMYVQEGE